VRGADEFDGHLRDLPDREGGERWLRGYLGAGPVATGRRGSADQADHEPGNSAASMPAMRSAATACAAVTPEPQ
jgi:hypothetical protein